MDRGVETIINEYGVRGYGLYFYCLEIISGTVDSENLTFELESDSAILARRLSMDTVEVEKIMHRFIELGLFNINDNGRIACIKLGKFLSSETTSNPEIRKIISSYKEKSGIVKISQGSPDQIRLDEIRLDKNREGELTTPIKDAENVKMTETEYSTLVNDFGKITIDKKIYDLDVYISNGGPKKPYKNHYKTILNWFRRDGIKKVENNICPKCKKVMTLSEWGKPICNCDRG